MIRSTALPTTLQTLGLEPFKPDCFYVIRFCHNIRHLLLVSLLGLGLLGVEIAQGFDLHAHDHQTVDCALCHFQLSDDSVVANEVRLPYRVYTFAPEYAGQFKATSSIIHPYQSRAPPTLVL